MFVAGYLRLAMSNGTIHCTAKYGSLHILQWRYPHVWGWTETRPEYDQCECGIYSWDIVIWHIDRSWKYQPTQENWTIPDVTRNYGYKLNDAWQLHVLAAGRAIPIDKERFKLPARHDGKLAHQNFKNVHIPWNVHLSVKFSECFRIVAWYSSFRWLVAFHLMASFSIAPGQGLKIVRSLIHLGMVTMAHPIIWWSSWEFVMAVYHLWLDRQERAIVHRERLSRCYSGFVYLLSKATCDTKTILFLEQKTERCGTSEASWSEEWIAWTMEKSFGFRLFVSKSSSKAFWVYWLWPLNQHRIITSWAYLDERDCLQPAHDPCNWSLSHLLSTPIRDQLGILYICHICDQLQ